MPGVLGQVCLDLVAVAATSALDDTTALRIELDRLAEADVTGMIDHVTLRAALGAPGPDEPSDPAAWAHAHAKVSPSGGYAWDDAERLIDTPFGRAKAEMVGRFERAYLHRCLMRHGGNVTQAARASAKHRRAFCALMRKHHLRAAPYRLAEDMAGDDTALAMPLR